MALNPDFFPAACTKNARCCALWMYNPFPCHEKELPQITLSSLSAAACSHGRAGGGSCARQLLGWQPLCVPMPAAGVSSLSSAGVPSVSATALPCAAALLSSPAPSSPLPAACGSPASYFSCPPRTPAPPPGAPPRSWPRRPPPLSSSHLPCICQSDRSKLTGRAFLSA